MHHSMIALLMVVMYALATNMGLYNTVVYLILLPSLALWCNYQLDKSLAWLIGQFCEILKGSDMDRKTFVPIVKASLIYRIICICNSDYKEYERLADDIIPCASDEQRNAICDRYRKYLPRNSHFIITEHSNVLLAVKRKLLAQTILFYVRNVFQLIFVILRWILHVMYLIWNCEDTMTRVLLTIPVVLVLAGIIVYSCQLFALYNLQQAMLSCVFCLFSMACCALVFIAQTIRRNLNIRTVIFCVSLFLTLYPLPTYYYNVDRYSEISTNVVEPQKIEAHGCNMVIRYDPRSCMNDGWSGNTYWVGDFLDFKHILTKMGRTDYFKLDDSSLKFPPQVQPEFNHLHRPDFLCVPFNENVLATPKEQCQLQQVQAFKPLASELLDDLAFNATTAYSFTGEAISDLLDVISQILGSCDTTHCKIANEQRSSLVSSGIASFFEQSLEDNGYPVPSKIFKSIHPYLQLTMDAHDWLEKNVIEDAPVTELLWQFAKLAL